MAQVEGGSNRVRFDVEQIEQHDSEIVTKHTAENVIEVHLGFLEIHHFYQIKFTIKDNYSEDLLSDPLQNLNLKITQIMPSEDGEGHEITMDFSAYKEKLVREELVVKDSQDPSKQLTLKFLARVLGKGKGTPALRSGIHCTGINAEEDSEQSDWQGFD